MRISRPMLSALLLSLTAGACRDLPTTQPATQPADASRVQLRCAVEVRARTLTCEPAGPRGARRQIFLGGQGLNVRLRTTNVVWNGAENLLSADLSVQNLLDQPLGTDGVTTHGVRVFFVSGPNVTDGSGQVTVLADSVGTFTAANQKYYLYPEIIQPRGISSPVTWRFSVPSTALHFVFMVLVETVLPVESSILHMRFEHGTLVDEITGVWAASEHDVFAAAGNIMLHYDGNSWRVMELAACRGCYPRLRHVWGSDVRDVWAVGDSGAVRHWTGATWDPVAVPEADGNDLNGVWGTGRDDVWIWDDVGLLHWDGASWARHPVSAANGMVTGVWGTGTQVWAVTNTGTVLRYDGTLQRDTTLEASLAEVWGTSANDVWAAGSRLVEGQGDVLFHYNGKGWTNVADPMLSTDAVTAGWSGGPDDVWVSAGDHVLHWDGVEWTRRYTFNPPPYDPPIIYDISGSGPGDVYAVGNYSLIAHSNSGGGMTEMALWEECYFGSVWGSSANDVWVAGTESHGISCVAHRAEDGSWKYRASPVLSGIVTLWGASASQVWAVGEGKVWYYNGAGWALALSPSGGYLHGVWGSSASDVWAVGSSGLAQHWNGATWSGSNAGTSYDLTDVWGSGPDNVFAVSSQGAIVHWTGLAWVAMNSGTTQLLKDVWGSGPADVYAVGANATVLHYDGNPAGNWTALATGAAAGKRVDAVWGSGANNVYILANDGRELLHWDGAFWRSVWKAPATLNDWTLHAMWGSGPNDLYTVGDYAIVLHGQR